MQRTEEMLLAEIQNLAKSKKRPEFKTPTMLFFRDVEDLIAHIQQSRYAFFLLPAYRYYCRESRAEDQNRLYYEVNIKKGKEPFESNHFIHLVAGEATDYSGHGNHDRELAEFFIQRVLKLPVEERPLSYLFDEVVNELYKKTNP